MRPPPNTQRGTPSGQKNNLSSRGPGVHLRGTPRTLRERYKEMAQEARASGDPVLMEVCLQYADHYTRLVPEAQRSGPPSAPESGAPPIKPKRLRSPYARPDSKVHDHKGLEEVPFLKKGAS